MPLPVSNLDDRTFTQLASEARSLIPKYFPTWTDHNPSDPGITLLELFAFLFEAAIYHLNRIPEHSLEHFAALVGVIRQAGEPIETTLPRALETLEQPYRAITETEFATLAKQALPEAIARAKAVVEVADTPHVFPDEQVVKVILVPNQPNTPAPLPSDAQRQAVFAFLWPRRLITTRVQVVPPIYTSVRLAVTVVRQFGSPLPKDDVHSNIAQAIRAFLSPLTGGVDGTGWEFGHSVFRSELYQLIEGLPGVDHVRQLLLNGDQVIGALPLASPTSLVRLDEDDLAVSVVDF